MKLNYKRTFFAGTAFFLICAFWQAYDNTIPLALTNKFGMSQGWSGFIMALDNILALILLPLFGAISDKTETRLGKRTPFIIVGTCLAIISFIILGAVDKMQLRSIEKYTDIDNEKVLEEIYDRVENEKLVSSSGKTFVLNEEIEKEAFIQLRSTAQGTDEQFMDYVIPARRMVIHRLTSVQPGNLIIFMVFLLLTLVSMSIFRSPAVALMPDITIKPLRSKANAVINLMGAAGGVIVLILGIVFKTSHLSNMMMPYLAYYLSVAALMAIALLIFMTTVHENKFVAEMNSMSEKYQIKEAQENGETGRLQSEKKRSLVFLLLSIILWFMGYNSVTSKYSVYAVTVLRKNFNLTLIIAQAAAIVSYLPVGIVASRIGRKKTILCGVGLLTLSFFLAAFMTDESSGLFMNIIFALAGIAWATINVNSFPMVVEMCSGADVGRYTGIYYTASMAAQILTPILSGILMDHLGLRILFPYAVVFAGASFFTMLFVKHGDSKPQPIKGIEALGELE